MAMKQLEHLKDLRDREVAKHGQDDLFVKQLDAQIQGLERQQRQDYKTEQKVFGMTFGQPGRK
ncbi:hypothetical protein [Roseateles violae]|uniref:Uncharacterized protein n=1 Tax=Roseateles violae TaxID=3058042 RepID=A0ABT8DS39_9BURK|nr:hypothetical protein [Pelomonas sp. PFR6]MDN3919109.1 hypothetical protein [Pelomonas sp. PFR6]